MWPDETQMDAAEAKEMAERLYDIQAASCKDLGGYEDRNFLLKDGRGRSFVLKVMNARDSENLPFLEQQNEAMRAVAAAGLGSQEPMRSRGGRMTELEGLDGKRHAVRLLTFATGVTLEDLEVRISPPLMRSIGARVAQIDLLLARSFPPGVVSRQHTWSAWSAPQLRLLMEATPHLEDRGLLTEVLTCFEEDILPKMEGLKTGPIHSDANFGNIIVQRANSTSSDFRLNSIIDFGDLHSSAHIYGLASLCAYVMLTFVADQWTVDVSEYSAPKHCIAGYLSEQMFGKKELELLPKFVALRYAQSLAIGAYSFQVLNPNKESLLDTQKNGWRQLKHIWTANQNELLADWLSACSLDTLRE